MKYWILITLVVIGISSCTLNNQYGSFPNSSIQTIDMGEFKGLRIIEIASLNFPEPTTPTHTSEVFTTIDNDNFGDSLIQSLKRSDVRVLPSAQTKIHIDFTQLAMLEDTKSTMMTMTANVAVSRNGIVTRKTININSKAKFNIGQTKDNGVKMFIQELGDLLRQQSSFKR
ncbi:MAG: hypothetical protein ACJASL_000803 [Paraglaciecola sp.]|jgi:hypothetical protein